MTRDDIIRMAREAKIEFAPVGGCYTDATQLQRFADLVAEAEREACAKAIRGIDALHAAGLVDVTLDAIRARGQT